jgi:hypothetical protein
MTPEEEALLRAALKSALEMAPTQIIFCGAEEEDEESLAFNLVEFEGGAIGIILPSAWETIPDMHERCQGLLAQEEKALDGQPLD